MKYILHLTRVCNRCHIYFLLHVYTLTDEVRLPAGHELRDTLGYKLTDGVRPEDLIYGVPPGIFCQSSCRPRHFYKFEQFYIFALFCISTVYQRIYARPYLYNLLTSLLLADLLCPAAHLQSVSIWCMSNIWHIPGISAVCQHIYDTAGILQSIDIFDTY